MFTNENLPEQSAANSPENSIHDLTEECKEAFRKCLEKYTNAKFRWLETCPIWLQIWSATLKVTDSGQSPESLDHRLRNHKSERDFICGLLRGITERLQNGPEASKVLEKAEALEFDILVALRRLFRMKDRIWWAEYHSSSIGKHTESAHSIDPSSKEEDAAVEMRGEEEKNLMFYSKSTCLISAGISRLNLWIAVNAATQQYDDAMKDWSKFIKPNERGDGSFASIYDTLESEIGSLRDHWDSKVPRLFADAKANRKAFDNETKPKIQSNTMKGLNMALGIAESLDKRHSSRMEAVGLISHADDLKKAIMKFSWETGASDDNDDNDDNGDRILMENPLPTRSYGIPVGYKHKFIKRRTIFNQIRARLAVSAGRVALVGASGLGKTHLAVDYCYRTREHSPETWVFWVYAGNEELLRRDFCRIANLVGLPGRDDPQTDVLQLVLDWIRNEKHDKWLLVLDGADDRNQLPDNFSSYLPENTNGTILVTCRAKPHAVEVFEEEEIIHIPCMDLDESHELLKAKLGDTVEKTSTTQVAFTYQFVPIALAQAAIHIQERGPQYSFQQYLEEVHKFNRAEEHREYEKGMRGRLDLESPNNIAIPWKITFNHLTSIRKSAAELLMAPYL